MSKTTLRARDFHALRAFKAEVFQVLAHPTRIHIIETLRDGESSVGAILERVKVEPTNLSQHLSLLRLRHLVVTRKERNQVLYSLRDPLLIEVLDAMRKYFQRHFEDSMQMLKQTQRGR
jgi:DNA-binding transcriptional ArsR family regulator